MDKCVICGTNSFRKVTGRGNWQVQACLSCTNAFTFPPPDSDRQYEDNAFFDVPIEQLPRWRVGAAEVIRFLTESDCHGSLLDVGFGSGLFIEAALAAGFEAQGIEASHPAVMSARKRGLNVTEGYLQEGSFAEGTFDTILMSHVLEHVADPRSLLTAAARFLASDGYLCLSQTNYLGTLPRLLGPRWYAWVPAEHFTHFSLTGITYLLQSAGFQIKAAQVTTLFWDWIDFTRLPIRHWPGALLHDVAAVVNRTRFGFPFVGDNLIVLAQRAAT
jgi:2-polyprenyl-3-methyl-5-hydroxy-6-metoxy-1,4-benzoquinol methylase